MVKRKKIVRQKQKQKQSQNVIINIHNLKKKRQDSKKIISRPITTYPIFQESPPPVPIIQLNTPPPVQYYQNPLMPVTIKESIPLTVTSEEEKVEEKNPVKRLYNPYSGRYITVGGIAYKKMIKIGSIILNPDNTFRCFRKKS